MGWRAVNHDKAPLRGLKTIDLVFAFQGRCPWLV